MEQESAGSLLAHDVFRPSWSGVGRFMAQLLSEYLTGPDWIMYGIHLYELPPQNDWRRSAIQLQDRSAHRQQRTRVRLVINERGSVTNPREAEVWIRGEVDGVEISVEEEGSPRVLIWPACREPLHGVPGTSISDLATLLLVPVHFSLLEIFFDVLRYTDRNGVMHIPSNRRIAALVHPDNLYVAP